MKYKDEYDFLNDNIDSGRSPKELAQGAFDYGLDGNKVLDIIQTLFQEGLLTSRNVPSLYSVGPSTAKLLAPDWAQVKLRLKKLQQEDEDRK